MVIERINLKNTYYESAKNCESYLNYFIEEIHNFFDTEIPFTSERDFRTLTILENELFKRYEEYCQNNKIKSVGHTYFLKCEEKSS